MTDNEIIKALECCKKDDCDNCPNSFGNCYANLAGYAFDLINRQKAEIDRLEIELKAMRGAANSYKVLIDGLKEKGVIADDTAGAKTIKIKGISADVKEMESETNA